MCWPALRAEVVGPHGGGALDYSDTLVTDPITIAPGATATRDVEVPTVTCGDTSTDKEPALPASTYHAGVNVGYTDARIMDDPSPSPTGSPVPSPSPTAAPKLNPAGSWGAATTLQITS